MKVLVTGGAGYIGSHVVRQLAENNHQTIVLDNLSTGFRESLLHNEELIIGDTGDSALLDQIFKKNQIKTVFHFAASVVVPESVQNPIKYYQNNTLNTLTLIDACVRHGVENFIYSSTAAVYGTPNQDFVAEECPILPINPYGSSKMMGEEILKSVANVTPNLRYMILRYFNVAGADPKARIGQRTQVATHLIKIGCQTALGLRDKIEIYGRDYPTTDGTCVRDYIHVEDLATAHLLAFGYLLQGKPSLTLNVGYGQGKSVLEVLNIIQKVSGVEFKIQNAPRRPGDPSKLIAKSDHIREILHWKPQYESLETLIQHAWQWEQKLAKS